MFLLAVVALIGVGVGVLVGYLSHSSSSAAAGPCLGRPVPPKIVDHAAPDITRRIVELMSADSISHFHR